MYWKIESGFIENIVNNRGVFDDKTIKIIEQYIVADMLYKLKYESDFTFGEIMEYTLEKELLSDDMLIEVKCKSSSMTMSYVAVKKKEDIYILRVNSINKEKPSVDVTKTIGYCFDDAVYIHDYKEDLMFEEILTNNKMCLANRLSINLRKDLFSEVVAIYDSKIKEIEKKENISVELEDRKAKIKSKNFGKFLKEIMKNGLTESYEFKASKIDSNLYLNIFMGTKKDEIVNAIAKDIFDGDYLNITKTISEYGKNRKKFIETYCKEKESQIREILMDCYLDGLSKKELIEESRYVFECYERVCLFNRAMVQTIDDIKQSCRENGCRKFEISFNGATEKIKASTSLEVVKSPLHCSGLEFTIYGIESKAKSKSSDKIDIININKLEPFKILLKDKVILEFEDRRVDLLKKLLNDIKKIGLIN